MGSQAITEESAEAPESGFRARLGEAIRSAAASRYLDRLALGSTVLVMTGLNMLWVALDSRPPYWDMALHLGNTLITNDSFTLAHPSRFLTTYGLYPPFAYWVTDAFYLFLGTAQWVAILSQAVFLAVLMYSTYGIGKLLWNRRVGLLAAYFVATTPMVVSLFKWYMLDTPLTAMAALALYLLLRSESFASRKFSLLFGAVCGFGLLTKWTFPLVMWLPVAAALVVPLTATVVRRSLRPLVNALAAGLLAFAICGVWYIHNYSALRTAHEAFNDTWAAIEGDPPVASVPSVLWYAWNLLDEQLYFIPFLFFVGGAVFVWRKNESAARNFYPVLAIVGCYVSFTLLKHKDYRFTLPILPAVAVVAVSWLEYLRPKVRRVLTGVLLGYGAAAFLAISFGTSLLPKDLVVHLRPRAYTSDLGAFMPGYDAGSATRARGIVLFAQHGWLVGPPTHERWYQEDAFREIATRNRSGSTFWFKGRDSIWFNTWGTRYYSIRYHSVWVASPGEAQFLIVRGPVPAGVTDGFARIKRFRLPDGETLTLYQRV
jgi:4-amino-4-deoxy-L-arabinose transferase-like glycosyltransferase